MSDPFRAHTDAPTSPEDREVDHLREILHHLTALEEISPEAKMRVLGFVISVHGETKAKRGRPPK